ncbi:MAG TPA: hypothetical protein VKW04_10325 [Planctomycetota bacterium]|nr:hypothetical protein [Planctomycetota bacterium]
MVPGQLTGPAPQGVASPPPPVAMPVGLGLLILLGLSVGFLLRVNPDLGYAVLNEFGVRGCSQRPSNERNASTSLKTIAAAQFDFRSGDRDWNDLKDFWRKDIAGLYALHPAADLTRTPIKLIELSVASADDRPTYDIRAYAVPSAKAGYWFRALLHEDENPPSPDRFAACAFPDSPGAGKWTYIIDEENVVYRKELNHQRGIDRYPADPIQAGWQKLD